MIPRPPAHLSGVLCILAAVLFWGTLPFVLAYLAHRLEPGQLVTIRWLVAGSILTAAARPRRLYLAIRRHPLVFLGLSLMGVAVPSVLYAYALRETTSIPALTFISNCYPVWSIALAVVFLRERLSVYHFAGLACSISGLALMAGIVPGRNMAAVLRVSPDVVLVVLASLGWATSSVISKTIVGKVDVTTLSAGRHLLAGLMLLPLAFMQGKPLTVIGGDVWLAMLALVAMSIASWQFYYWGLAHISVSTSSLIESLSPVITWGVSALFLGKGLTGSQILAAVLILFGTTLVSAREAYGHPMVSPATKTAD